MQQLSPYFNMYTWRVTMSSKHMCSALHRTEIGIKTVKMEKIFMA